MTYISKPSVHDVPILDDIPYDALAVYYTQCLKEHGPTAQGVDWPTEEGALIRHRIMANLWSQDYSSPLSILDLGCGYGGFLTYLKNRPLRKPKKSKNDHEKKSALSPSPYALNYTGIDLSPEMITAAQQLHPNHDFRVHDVIHSPLAPNSFDYGVMNGVLTEKRDLSFEDMCLITETLIYSLFKTCRKGIAFNVMNDHVDFKRPHLFYLSFDRLVAFLTEKCSRHITIHADYGLYEYTVYVYHHAPSTSS